MSYGGDVDTMNHKEAGGTGGTTQTDAETDLAVSGTQPRIHSLCAALRREHLQRQAEEAVMETMGRRQSTGNCSR